VYFPASASLRGGEVESQSPDDIVTYPGSGVPEIEVPIEKGYNIEITRVTAKAIDSTCPQREIGEEDVTVGSVNFSVSLGRNLDGGVAGDLVLSAEKVGPLLYSPGTLERSSYFSSSIQTVKDATGNLLQIKAPQCLVDIEIVSSAGYRLRVYLANQVGNLNPATLRYDLNGQPSVVYEISNPDNTGAERLAITKRKNGLASAKLFSNDGSGVALSGDDIATEKISSTVSGAERREVRRHFGPDNALLGEVTTVYRNHPYIATNFLGHGTVNPKANESDD
jgi:hypothetical protein